MNKPKMKIHGHPLKRTVKMLFKFYPVLVPFTIFCILFSAAAAAIPNMLTQRIITAIETYQPTRNWCAAWKEISVLIIFLISMYVVSLILTVIYNQILAIMTHGFLNKFRVKMFNGMQNLPIKYFDTHKHGDIMSYYTNDLDTLRELVSG